MKASFKFILAALAATAALAACTKEITSEEAIVVPSSQAAEGTRVIAVSFAPQTKTTLDGFQPKFEDGKDTVLISNTNALDTCVVSVKDNKATISTNLTGPLTAVYPYKAAKMSEDNENEIDTVLVSTVQSGKFADANICMAKMKDEKDESLSFENKTALFKIIPGAGADTKYVEVSAEGFDIANHIPTGSTNTDYSAIRVPSVTTDSVYVSILVPDGLKVNNLKFSDGTKEKAITTGAQATEEIAAGTLYTVDNENWESPEADTPEGALAGVFSVSATKQVYFSKGNLTYDVEATTNRWKFYEHQYDCAANGDASSTLISLFTWGYGTWSTSPDGTDYQTGDFTDWGSQIGDGNTWRTLTTAEWQYLFNYGDYTSDVRNGKYKWATVNGVNGYVIAPDDFSGELANTYADDAALASAGNLVFLPAAGRRFVSSVSLVGDRGYYWSSTASDSDRAYYVYFISTDVLPDNSGDRLIGFSVRLITDVPSAPTPTEPEYVEITMTVGGQEKTYKWAKCNLGAETETDYGDYYAWGTTVEAYTDVDYAKTTGAFTFKSDNPYGDIYKNNWTSASGFAWLNTPFTNGKYSVKNKKVFTKYVPEDKKSIYGYNDFYDNKTVLELEDDVANKVLGGTWRMPTKEEFDALCNLTKEWKTNYNNSGVDGYLFTDKNNHSIFLPAAGYGDGTDLGNVGDDGGYWSSSLYTDNPSVAYCLGFNVGDADTDFYYRYYGQSVRALSE